MKTWQLAVLWVLIFASPWYAKKLPKGAGPVAGVCAAIALLGFLAYSMPWEYSAGFALFFIVACNLSKFPAGIQAVIATVGGAAVVVLIGYLVYLIFTGHLSLAEMNEMSRDFPDRY